jgi:hypothetical protein
MALQQSAQVVVPPVTIDRGNRSVAIDIWPLPIAGSASRDVELRQPHPDCLELGARKKKARWSLLLAAIPVAVTIAGGIAVNAAEDRTLGIITAAFFVVLGLLLLLAMWYSSTQCIQFDRRTGAMRVLRKPRHGRREDKVIKSRPLADIVCVQLLYGGFHTVTTTNTSTEPYQGGTQTEQFYSYQMNLVVDDPKEPRFNLTSHSDWQWMRQTGTQLADFLQVPVVDQLYHGG